MPLRRLWAVLPLQSDCSKAHWRWRRWRPWGQRFAPVLAQCGLYWLVFSGTGILAAGLGQKRSKQICTLFGQGTRLCGAILVLYFFLVILSTLLLLLGGNGG